MAFTESMFWNTDGTGDGPAGGYSRNHWGTLLRTLFGTGVLRGVGDELIVSGAASPLSVGIGAAVVDGIFGANPSPEDVEVPTPSVGTTGHRIVLRATWGSTQELRVALKSNADGVPLSTQVPGLQQDSGVLYEEPLARFDITTAGVIQGLTNEQRPCPFTRPFSKGDIRLWSGAMGGPSNHHPIDPSTGTAQMDWHLCNGETVNGVATPDLRNRFIVGADSSFPAKSTGGALTHQHTYSNVPSHSHGAGTLAVGSAGAHQHSVSTVDAPTWDGAYTAFQYGKGDSPSSHPTQSAGNHTHSLSGSTASAGVSSPSTDSASSLPPYYALVFLCYVGYAI